MDTDSAARDFLVHRNRFCAELGAVATTLASILRSPAEDQEPAQITRCFQRLSRLRADLGALLREQSAIRSSAGYRKLRHSDRRAIEDGTAFGCDPRRMLDAWNRIIRAAHMGTGFSPTPLYPPERAENDPEVQRWAALDRAMAAVHEFINPREPDTGNDRGDTYFADIPLPTTRFLQGCHAALRVCLAQDRSTPLRFLDVGCGGGVKVLMAGQFFTHVHGLEIDPVYFDTADGFLSRVGEGRAHAIRGDALEFTGYGDYDVLYFYQPIRDSALLAQLEARIAETAYAGTVLIAPYTGFADRATELGCARVSGDVWLTDTSQDEADALAARARTMGTVLTPVPFDINQQAGLLGPIVDALAERGFLVP